MATAKAPPPAEGAAPLKLQLLGGFRAWIGPRPVADAAWTRRKAAHLVKRLALAPAHRLHREQALEQFWPELDLKSAENNLHKALYHARRALEPSLAGATAAGYLRLVGEYVCLCPAAPIEVDVEHFEALAQRARYAGTAAAIEAALAAYPGDLLPEDPYEDWTAPRREALRQDAAGLLAELARLHTAGDDPARAIDPLQRLVALDPTHEPAHLALMRLYAQLGQRHDALRQFRTLADSLRRDLDTTPSPEAQRLHEAVGAGDWGLGVGGRGGAASPAPPRPPAPNPQSLTPTGIVTLLLVAAGGRAQLGELAPEVMRPAVAVYAELAARVVGEHGGVVVGRRGAGQDEALIAAFHRATDAVAAATALALALAGQEPAWPAGAALAPRLVLHAGESDRRDGAYAGAAVERGAGLLATAHPGQLLLSRPVHDLVHEALPPGTALRSLGEHRLRATPRAEPIYQLDVAGLPADFPPLATPETHRHNLPAPRTELLGREDLLADLRDLLHRPGLALLTLIGPAGTGKTRLALQLARDCLDDFPDGVWFVDLSPIADPTLVASTMAGVLGVRETGDRPLAETLGDALRGRRLLLVLDNMEQVVEAAPVLGEVLRRAPNVRALVTSRERLHLSGEHLFEVPPLALPDLDALPHAADLPAWIERSPAVRLFVDRAAEVRTGFTLTPANAGPLAEICRRLDGLPLAIELAAAWTRFLPLAVIRQRLDQPLQLLTSPTRDQPSRHRTLRDAIAWSYDLLAPEEQTLFRRLAVFVGGFTLDVGAGGWGLGVGGREGQQNLHPSSSDPRPPTPDPLDIVASLLDKSLLGWREQPDGEARYGMLATLREYAFERLVESGEADAVRQAHAEYFLALAEAAEPELRGPVQVEWAERLERDHDNLRAALAWWQSGRAEAAAGADEGDAGAGVNPDLRLAARLGLFWFRRGYLSEGRRWLTRALARDHARAGDHARADAEADVDVIAQDQTGAEADVDVIAQDQTGAESIRALARFALASLAIGQSDFETARPLLREAAARYDRLGNRAEAVRARISLAMASERSADEAAASYDEAIDLARRLDQPAILAAGLQMYGAFAFRRGDIDRAAELVEEGLAVCERAGDRWRTAWLLKEQADIAIRRQDFALAERAADAAFTLCDALGDQRLRASCTLSRGTLARQQGDLPRARLVLREAARLALDAGELLVVGLAFNALGSVAASAGLGEQAILLFGAGRVILETPGMPRQAGADQESAEWLARLRTQLGDEAFAAAWRRGQTLTPAETLTATA